MINPEEDMINPEEDPPEVLSVRVDGSCAVLRVSPGAVCLVGQDSEGHDNEGNEEPHGVHSRSHHHHLIIIMHVESELVFGNGLRRQTCTAKGEGRAGGNRHLAVL